MHDVNVGSGARSRNAWRWVAGGAAVIGALWVGSAVYDGGGKGASVFEGTTAGAAGGDGGRQAVTRATTPQAAAAPRPPLDLAETPAVETATFALG
ncbi:MAG: hypothetical protein EHM71_00815 [Zetaproteobacteria bacterium]|nr:MAG: hypothetical protein EHM71_00815 [Zetaproteobacteria bacterium]